jgi:dihydroneopterin aldolase
VTDRISLSGIEVYAHHGVYDREKESGQRFLIDVELFLDLSKAGGSDDLKDTVDYGALAVRVQELVAGERWDLIERVAERVAELGLQDGRVEEVRVRVAKPDAPIPVPFKSVSVILRRRRK